MCLYGMSYVHLKSSNFLYLNMTIKFEDSGLSKRIVLGLKLRDFSNACRQEFQMVAKMCKFVNIEDLIVRNQSELL